MFQIIYCFISNMFTHSTNIFFIYNITWDEAPVLYQPHIYAFSREKGSETRR